MLVYEDLLARDLEWALNEGSRHFEEKSAVQLALRKIARRLNDLGVPYAVVGGMALFAHGLRRFTEDVDIVVPKQGLKRIHEKLDGLGYVRPFEKSKNLRDTEFGVKIEFLISGQYPGDGKPKPVAFPVPDQDVIEQDGIKFVNLKTLIELKLASGISNPERMKDLSDVQELIKQLAIPESFRDQLNEYVQPKFDEIWTAVNGRPKKYYLLWRNKWLTAEAKSIGEMAAALKAAAEELDQMAADGIVLSADGGIAGDYAYLVTTDPAIAKKYKMWDESEFWDEDESDVSSDDASESDT